MILAIDVYYKEIEAKVVGVLFNWLDDKPLKIIQEVYKEIAPYQPGAFYKRELPCLLKLIEKVDTAELEAIVVDGHVYTDDNQNYGLGGKLWESLHRTTPVIGVAKSAFLDNKMTVVEVFRGTSKNPLYVSAIGCDLTYASDKILKMSGLHRIPTILKTLDKLTKS